MAVRLKPLGETAPNTANSYVTADPSRGELILRDPSNESNMAPSCRRQLAAVPKLFAFDAVFGGDAMQVRIYTCIYKYMYFTYNMCIIDKWCVVCVYGIRYAYAY